MHPDSRDTRSPGLFKVSPPSGSLTYETFYGLQEKPFSLSSDPRFLFKSPAHGPAFDRLLAGIRRREGLIALTGEPGTGKTTTCRAVLESLDRRTFSAFVPDPFVSREDLLKMLLVDFGVLSVEDLKAGRLKGASRPDLSYPLYEFLNSLVPLGAFAVLIIDEAQNLPLPLLEEIRILSDLEGREKLLQVVLIGQPELRANLKLPQMRQVDQRVSVHCELRPLGRAELTEYVAHRLNVAAGGVGESVHFTAAALDAVHDMSNGLPRMINRICDSALHQGWAQRTTTVDAATVLLALEELGLQAAQQEKAATEPEPLPAPVVEPPRAESPRRSAPRRQPLGEEELRSAPQFEAERIRRPRARLRPINKAAVAALMLVGLAVPGLAASSWYMSARDSLARDLNLPPLPSAPRAPITILTPLVLPAAAVANVSEPARVTSGHYVINVAVFESSQRASVLMTELADKGYPAYYSEFELAGERVWQVAVGEYDTVADAQVDLDRIRNTPGFSDARIRPAR